MRMKQLVVMEMIAYVFKLAQLLLIVVQTKSVSNQETTVNSNVWTTHLVSTSKNTAPVKSMDVSPSRAQWTTIAAHKTVMKLLACVPYAQLQISVLLGTSALPIHM